MTNSRLTIEMLMKGTSVDGVRLSCAPEAARDLRRWQPWGLSSITVRDALVAVRVTHDKPAVDEAHRSSLAAMIRAIGQVLADHGLLRPIVVHVWGPEDNLDALSPVDMEKRAVLAKWEDDQDWHRGRFVFFTAVPMGLLEPVIAGIERTQPVEAAGHASPDDSTVDETSPADDEAPAPVIEVEDDVTRLDKLRELLGWGAEVPFAEVRAWSKQWIEQHGRASPQERDREGVETALSKWVKDRLEDAAPLPSIVLASYSQAERVPDLSNVSREPIVRLFLADADTERGHWELAVDQPLREARERVKRRGGAVVVIHAKCTPAFAIRAGAVFHATTGVRASVIQGNPSDGTVALWTPTQGRDAPEIDLAVEAVPPTEPATEVQLRLSITRPVERDADAWTASAGPGVSPYLLRISMPRTGDQSIRDADHAWGIARRVKRELTELHNKLPVRLPTRIFYSGPVALAVWIGAQLNAAGEVILMDWLRTATLPRYVESFTFRPGA